MTREEAINHLSILFERISDTYEPEIHIADIPLEAIDMAIKVLEEPPNEDWEKYSENLYDKAYNRGRLDGLKCATEIIEELLDKEV